MRLVLLSSGYGHPAPLSDMGKVFSIIYALIGVPFTMLVLTACVQRVMQPLVLAPVGLLQRSGLKPRPATVLHFLLLLVLVVLCFFLAPAAVFSAVEVSWTFLDGFYFCFISLCTIGLGDFVPAAQPSQKYRALYQVAVMGELNPSILRPRSLCSPDPGRRRTSSKTVRFSSCAALSQKRQTFRVSLNSTKVNVCFGVWTYQLQPCLFSHHTGVYG